MHSGHTSRDRRQRHLFTRRIRETKRTLSHIGAADLGRFAGPHDPTWKVELARLAAETGLAITVCHLPPGTSKWNKIEHRLFSHISMNWRGRPLESHEVVVQLIAAATTRTGLSVQAELDEGTYPKGIKISDKQMRELPLEPHDFHGDWNYTLQPSR